METLSLIQSLLGVILMLMLTLLLPAHCSTVYIICTYADAPT